MAWPAHRGAYAQITWSRDAIAGSELAQLLPSLENPEWVVVRRDNSAALCSSELENGSTSVPNHVLDPARAKFSVIAECVYLERARPIQQ